MRERSLDELLNTSDDAWPDVQKWIQAAVRPAAVFEADRARAEATLLAAQVTTRSPMGAIVYHSAGISVDGGWIRILGAGSEEFGNGLREWNEDLGGSRLDPPLGYALIIAFDALGGFFVLNGGRWPDQVGRLRYLAPDATGWQGFELTYSDLVNWALSGDLDGFYGDQRWPGWQADMAELRPDRACFFYPPFGFKAADGQRSRSIVPLTELWTYHQDMARQTAEVPDGTEVRIKIVK